MKKIGKYFAVLLTLGLLLAACSGGGQEAAPAQQENQEQSAETTAGPSELIVGAEQEPVGFDPHKVPAASSVRIYALVYDSLTKLDENLNVVPGLASEWSFSDDGKTITFKLRKGVTFHNGREMTAEDVKYSFERILNPDTGSIAKSYFSSIETIETPDPYTVVFKLKYPDSAFIANSSSAYASIVAKEVGDLNKEAVGTGPFMLDTVESGQYVLLKKNPNYFIEGQPGVDAIKFQIMKDEAERLAALRAGRIDIAQVSADFAKVLKDAPGITVKSYQSMEYSYLGINVKQQPFDDPRVRQAISYAVDRSAIVEVVWKGEASLTGPIAPAQTAWALDTSRYPSYQTNVEKAKELLKEAGYPNGFETVLETASTYPDMVETAQVLQQQLQQIGIKTTINQLEWGNYIERWKSKEMSLLVGRNTSGIDPDRSMRFFFHTEGSANVWNYSNPQYDQLVQKALEATDPAERKSLYEEAQILLVEDAPNLFLASPKNFYAVSEKVVGFEPSAAGEVYALVKTAKKN
ncbi:ABC transporter substrate-binding protein [Brevibacillus marinus]|uniref:ABC transporter substrate-binding protein n=1 Tax=Brevibacillus marinus TaxID=2496837 RepID=UPI000F830889|nr:ABC transporter substrate-binding protein [Brevibacillus marinus]